MDGDLGSFKIPMSTRWKVIAHEAVVAVRLEHDQELALLPFEFPFGASTISQNDTFCITDVLKEFSSAPVPPIGIVLWHFISYHTPIRRVEFHLILSEPSPIDLDSIFDHSPRGRSTIFRTKERTIRPEANLERATLPGEFIPANYLFLHCLVEELALIQGIERRRVVHESLAQLLRDSFWNSTSIRVRLPTHIVQFAQCILSHCKNTPVILGVASKG
mmetsp:Transcript_46094/g.91403  ORF Transcript_46094/g.91403 Transcript_46094/m.91403 type:complete len:218 (+) Transcript_46094:77-730(+)